MKHLAQYNQYLIALHQMKDDFYKSAETELVGKIVKFTDEYINRYVEMDDDPEYESYYQYINPNTRMRIIEIMKYGIRLIAQVEYINHDAIDAAAFGDEISLEYLIQVDEE
ncbi:hypothetical protein ACRYKS_22180 [Escherichia coli]|uniref:hypothetical protein n=1 Tax=Escherichia coli TaxID=562 RepID=UPI003D934448|nr:hypothetical protein [Escherichia coli]HCJ8666424.1 hypothetical protein [Escherichia coli]